MLKIIPPKNGLTDSFIKKLTRQDKNYKVKDNGCKGLFLDITPAGRKIFRIRLTIDGTAVPFTVGHYPAISLADARTRAIELKAARPSRPRAG